VTTFLETVIAHTRDELAHRRAAVPIEVLRAQIEDPPPAPRFFDGLAAPGMSLIAEMKRASPSKGAIQAGASVAPIVQAYSDAGASAISVLTEPKWFQGSLDDLATARATVETPLLRKDFIVDEYQLVEARVVGASAALLIVAAFANARELASMIELATQLGLDTLVEVHDEREAAIAQSVGAAIIGINNRDLHTLEVDLSTSFRVRANIAPDTLVVAESGITTRNDVRLLEDAGVDAILVGEALMRVGNPVATAHELLGRNS